MTHEMAKQFNQELQKSVPFYKEGHNLICDLSDYFVKNDSVVWDLGTSTGEIPCKLALHNKKKGNIKYIGIDLQRDMIDSANYNKQQQGLLNVDFVCEDILQYQFEFEQADLITAYYTVQFIRPSARQSLVNKLYQSLKWGGALVMFEKVRANDARFQDIMTGIYSDYKLAHGYTAEEIVANSRNMKGVLEPFSSQGNLDMLKRAGFVDVISVMKYVCFEGFLAIK